MHRFGVLCCVVPQYEDTALENRIRNECPHHALILKTKHQT